MIIAIDGPAGSGKSSIAKEISKKLSIIHLDTGAIYRIITLYFLEEKLNIQNIENLNLLEILNKINIDIKGANYYLNNKLVNDNIRSKIIDQNVSAIAANKKIRDFSLNIQRKIANQNSAIIDGRDIGTVVFPNAEYKFFITASPKIRASRRLIQNDIPENEYDEVLKNLIQRDFQDMNRSEAPLKKANDAIEIDTTDMNFEQVVDKILSEVSNEN